MTGLSRKTTQRMPFLNAQTALKLSLIILVGAFTSACGVIDKPAENKDSQHLVQDAPKKKPNILFLLGDDW
jgi:hypothetical protein